MITFFTRRVLSTIRMFCMQSRIDAQYIIDIGADPNKVIVTGNTKYDQTYGIVTEAEKKRFLHELGFAEGTYPIMIAGSTHRGENGSVYKAFVKIRDHFPDAKLIIAPRYIYQADLIADEGIKHGITMVKRSDMKAGKPIKADYDGVILDTIGELGRVYSLGDLIFVACVMVKNEKEFIDTCLDILIHPDRAEAMKRSCIEVVQENQGATRKNLEQLQKMLDAVHGGR